MLHVFVHVVRSKHDPFAGIRAALTREGSDRCVDVKFDDAEFDYIDRVEYTERRFFRAILYPRLFRALNRRLDAAIGDEPRVVVYFADEGVWAAVWALYRRRHASRSLKAVNVQHGFALIRPPTLRLARKAVNTVSRLLTGFPSIGYGSLGAAGPKPFDLYLTYDEPTARFVREQTDRAAFPAPRLIKHELITSLEALPLGPRPDVTRVLFAMNINMRGSPVKCDVGETFDILLGLATELHRLGAVLVLRLHPGMDREAEIRRFATHAISKFAELDPNESLAKSMASSEIVMSFVSTVIWEAGLLGLVPVQVACACCDDVDLGFEREILNLEGEYMPQLATLLAQARAPRVTDWRQEEGLEWAALKSALAS